MEQPKNHEVKNVERLPYSEIIKPILKRLEIDEESLKRRYKIGPLFLERIKKAEALERKLELQEGAHKADANFAMILDTIVKGREVATILSQKLKDEIVVDLGCGSSDWGAGAIEQFNPSIYVGVDKYAGENILTQTDWYTGEREMQMKTAFIEQDALVFVSMLPENSVNFMMNGIDDVIIPDEEYWESIEKEVQRSLKPGGIIFGCGSIFGRFAKEGLKFVGSKPEEHEHFFIFEKEIK